MIGALQPIDMIVDGLGFHGYKRVDFRYETLPHSPLPGLIRKNSELEIDFIPRLISYANANKAPVLSLDGPSGLGNRRVIVDARNAVPLIPEPISAKWTLSFGLPSHGVYHGINRV